MAGLGARLASSQLRQAGLVSRSSATRTVTDQTQDGIVLEQRPARAASSSEASRS